MPRHRCASSVRTASGSTRLHVAHATALGIPVVNTPDANRASVAEHTIALMLAAAKRIVGADAATRRVDFDFKYRASLSDISGKVLGIVGFGGIGRELRPWQKSALHGRLVASRVRQGGRIARARLSHSGDPGRHC